MERLILACGNFSRRERYALAEATAGAAHQLVMAETAEEALGVLRSRPLHAMVVDTSMAEAQSLALEVRAESARSQLPVLALSRDLTDLAFEDAFSWGADDVVDLTHPRRLVGALRSLPRDTPEPPKVTRGRVLLAEADRTRRIVVGRVLRNAGYDVTFATSKEDMRQFARTTDLELIVANTEVEDAPVVAIDEARNAGNNAKWLLPTPPRELKARKDSLGGIEGARVMDGYAPPENVLFIANELTCGRGVDKRASFRLLYGSVAGFRNAGWEADDFGFVYNISQGGLYVRTTVPPTEDLVWLELRPPRSERRVRLVGKVAWRRRFGPNQTATVPPGFGLQLVDGASADLRGWRDGYFHFAGALGVSVPPD